jgi:hypothetical protein
MSRPTALGQRSLLDRPDVIAVGLELFRESIGRSGSSVSPVDWTPPAGGPSMSAALDILNCDEVDQATREALRRVLAAEPWLVDVQPASEVVPGFTPNLVLHAGPPIVWDQMCGPMRGAVAGALVFEGLAVDLAAAEAMAASGEIRFEPCHHRHAVGPMAGVLTRSMPVFVVENRTFGNRAYSSLNEGLGRVLRYGANSEDVLGWLAWMRDELGPALGRALRGSGGLDVRAIVAQAVQMGDECHNRNRAASGLLLKALAPHLAATGRPGDNLVQIFEVIGGNEHFFLNVGMAACKATLEPSESIPLSALVTTMARNGTEFGICVAGLAGEWFTAPAEIPRGLYFPGFSESDCNPDIGDSAITETAGLGGFAMAAAPAIVQFVGGTPSQALAATGEMYEITAGESDVYRIPILDFRGTPTGIDVRKVVRLATSPLINTGIAHRLPGIGQVGAGIVRAPMACFEQAVVALASRACPDGGTVLP